MQVVRAVYDPGEDIGFLYTIGRDGPEFFTDGVPRSMAEKMCCLFNFLEKRDVKHAHVVESHGIIARVLRCPDDMLPTLHENYTCGAEPEKGLFILWPIDKWGTILDGWLQSSAAAGDGDSDGLGDGDGDDDDDSATATGSFVQPPPPRRTGRDRRSPERFCDI